MRIALVTLAFRSYYGLVGVKRYLPSCSTPNEKSEKEGDEGIDPDLGVLPNCESRPKDRLCFNEDTKDAMSALL